MESVYCTYLCMYVIYVCVYIRMYEQKYSSFAVRDEFRFLALGNKEQIKKKKWKVNAENHML